MKKEQFRDVETTPTAEFLDNAETAMVEGGVVLSAGKKTGTSDLQSRHGRTDEVPPGMYA